MPDISIIIPTLNEERVLPLTLSHLQNLRRQQVEIIVVDGGSTDNTAVCTEGLVDRLVFSKAGRAAQLNKGAQVAQGPLLLFLHADTLAPKQLVQLLNQPLIKKRSDVWGRFNVKLDGEHFLFRIIEMMMNGRSCFTGIVTGDHAMFVSRKLFKQVDGYPVIELMEDIAISKKLKRINRPICIKQAVVTSSRRWEQAGIINTIFKMWLFRLAYFFKVPPAILSKKY